MQTFKFLYISLCLSTLTYAGNTGPGSSPITPSQSIYNSQWSSFHQPPPILQKKHGIPSETLSTSNIYIDQNGERWALFQEPDGSYWGVNSQEEFKRFNQLPIQN